MEAVPALWQLDTVLVPARRFPHRGLLIASHLGVIRWSDTEIVSPTQIITSRKEVVLHADTKFDFAHRTETNTASVSPMGPSSASIASTLSCGTHAEVRLSWLSLGVIARGVTSLIVDVDSDV